MKVEAMFTSEPGNFNMLFDNEAYDKLIREWAAVSGYFSIFVMLAVKIIEGIKWVSKKTLSGRE
ncbi:MAG: hypothetical protein IPH20_12815 [Bacteroidales bacterium]|nr:hypothetical protein [Bacteroidales bacterium]